MRWVVTLGVVVSLALALASCGGGSTTTVTTTAAIRMPRVTGQDATRAEATLQAVGLKTSYIEVPNEARPGTVLAQHPATGSPVPNGSKATLTISASPAERNAVRGARGGTACGGVIHFTGIPREAGDIGVAVASCREAKDLVRTAHGTLGGCEKGARCDVGGYTCTQTYFGGPSMAVQCVSRKPANVPGPQATVRWQWAGYNMTAGTAASAAANDPKPIGLIPCQVRSGGSDVQALHISCRRTSNLLRHWNPSPALFGNKAPRDILLTRGSWRCWSRLEKKGGPITNVCWHGPAVIVYSFS